MNKKAIRLAAALLAAALAACNFPGTQTESDAAGTQTAEAAQLAGTSTAVAASIFATQTVQAGASAEGCAQFVAEEMDVVLVSLAGSGEESLLYFHIPGDVPGMAPGDTDEETYVAQVGAAQSSYCRVYEGYEERLYCGITLPGGYLDSRRDISLFAKGCEAAVLSLEGVSIQAAGLVEESEHAGGGNGGGPSCGDQPPTFGSCSNNSYQTWCSCMGGSYLEDELAQGLCNFGCYLP